MVDFLKVSKFFFFNVSANVGFAQPNKLDDVELVRFGYKMKRINPKAKPEPELNTVIDRMAFQGPFGPDLQAAIVQHQRIVGGTQDGRVSRASTFKADGSYDGAHLWLIEILSNNMRVSASDIFPRLDIHPNCGPELVKTLKDMFIHGVK